MTYYPQEPTDWTKGLSAVYDRQSKQLEEHHADLRARDAREVEVKKQESFVNTLAKVAEFSTAARSAVDTYKARKEKKDTEFKGNVMKSLYEHPELLEEFTEKYNSGKRDVWKDSKLLGSYLKDLAQREEYDKVKWLDRFDGRKQLLIREALAEMMAPKVISDPAYKAYIADSDNYKKGETLKSITEDKFHRQNWEHEQLFTISDNKDFVSKFLFPEASRKNSTNKNLRKAQSQAQYDLSQDVLAKGILKSKSSSVDSNSIAVGMVDMIQLEVDSGKYQEIEGGLSIREQATDTVVDKFVQLNLEGHVPQSALTGLNENLFPAGSIVQGYFAKDGSHLNRIVTANRIGQSKVLGVETAKDEALALDLKRRALDGEDVTRELQHLRSRNLLSDETIKGIENTTVADNTQDAYKDESKYWNKSMQNGTLLTKENVDLAKSIKNEKLKAEVLGAQEKLQSSYNLNGFDSYEKRQRANGSLIMKQSQNRTLGENEVLEGFNERLQDEITNLESKLYAYYYNLNPEDSQIGIKVAIDKKKILDDNGFYAQPGDANEGIYTKDSNGNFTNYQNSLIGKVQVSKLPTERNRTIWSSNLYNVWERASNDFTLTGDTVKERVLNTLNSTLTPQDIIGIFESGEISDKLMYTAELFPDTNETEILIGATKALIASKDKEHQQIVKGFKLEEKLKNIPTVQLKLKDKIKSLNDFDLNGIIDRGLQNASPKEKIRLYAKLLEIADKSNEETAEMNSN